VQRVVHAVALLEQHLPAVRVNHPLDRAVVADLDRPGTEFEDFHDSPTYRCRGPVVGSVPWVRTSYG
jgi:hypothetical protein